MLQQCFKVVIVGKIDVIGKLIGFYMIRLVNLVALLCVLMFPSFMSAQDFNIEQDTQELMRQISEKMRQVEQALARASLEPENIIDALRQLQDMQRDGQLDTLPPSLLDFINQNREWLSQRSSNSELELTEREIERLLENDPSGMELLNRFPNMLHEMMEDEDTLKELIENFQREENDLDELFNRTENTMRQTESDIERLLEMAQAMQSQMNQSSRQNLDQLENMRRQSEQRNQQSETQEGDDRGNGGASSSEPNNAGDSTDPDLDGWDIPGLPRREVESFRNSQRGSRPNGYEAESDAYFRMLAQAWRRIQRLRNDSE